jgi:hypothetical protein
MTLLVVDTVYRNVIQPIIGFPSQGNGRDVLLTLINEKRKLEV